MGLTEDVGAGPVAVDSCVFIYFVEEHAELAPVIGDLFEAIDGGQIRAVASELALLEVLVAPYRHDRIELAQRYEAILGNSRGLDLIPLERSLLRGAARLRALRGTRAADSLHLVTAMATRSTAFVTDDRRLPALPGVRVLQLADYV